MSSRHRRATSRLAALVATATLLAGCGGGDGDEPPANAGGTTTPGETTASAAAPETTGPPHWLDGVEPAAGERVHNGAFSMHLPEGFEMSSDLSSGGIYRGPGNTTVSVSAFDEEPLSLREVRRKVVRDHMRFFVATPRSRPDVEVDGEAMIRYTARNGGEANDLFATSHRGYFVILHFATFHQDTDLEAVYRSTLASLEWK